MADDLDFIRAKGFRHPFGAGMVGADSPSRAWIPATFAPAMNLRAKFDLAGRHDDRSVRYKYPFMFPPLDRKDPARRARPCPPSPGDNLFRS